MRAPMGIAYTSSLWRYRCTRFELQPKRLCWREPCKQRTHTNMAMFCRAAALFSDPSQRTLLCHSGVTLLPLRQVLQRKATRQRCRMWATCTRR
jgi:hypothetical protein